MLVSIYARGLLGAALCAVASGGAQLERMLGRMASGGTERTPADSKPPGCSSMADILTQLGTADLEGLCPAILRQVALPPCPPGTAALVLPSTPAPPKTVDYNIWGYGVLAVTIINLSALLGLVLVPFTKKPYFSKVLTYFIGLAIGTLFSNAVLQLIPEALGFDPKSDNYVSKAVGIFGGFYLLFVTEKVLKMVLNAEHPHGHGHFSAPESFPSNSLQNGEASVEIVSVTSFSSNKPDVMCDPLTQQDESRRTRTCSCFRAERLSKIKTVAWMISLSDALHNFIDGLAIGASFTVSLLTGFSTSIAIVCEEFPHELGDFVILLNAGMTVPQAIFFNLISAMSCYVGLVLGILLGSNFAPNIIFALAGGMFLYIALTDMFPEMNSIMSEQERTIRTQVTFLLIQNAGLLTGFATILLITMFAGEINLG